MPKMFPRMDEHWFLNKQMINEKYLWIIACWLKWGTVPWESLSNNSSKCTKSSGSWNGQMSLIEAPNNWNYSSVKSMLAWKCAKSFNSEAKCNDYYCPCWKCCPNLCAHQLLSTSWCRVFHSGYYWTSRVQADDSIELCHKMV